MATVFDLFKQTQYGYYELSRGTVFGNIQGSEEARTLMGVFKKRKGFTIDGRNMETFGSDSPTLHAHPEDFSDGDPIVGNGVIVDGVKYEIKGATYGTNFDTGVVEHIRLTLQESDFIVPEPEDDTEDGENNG